MIQMEKGPLRSLSLLIDNGKARKDEDEEQQRQEAFPWQIERQKNAKKSLQAFKQVRLLQRIAQMRERKRGRKALRVQAASDRLHVDVVDREIDDTRGTLKEQYGFVADPALPLWENMKAQLVTVDVTELLTRPKNATCHNLRKSRSLPDGTPQLLTLGMNYCIKNSSSKHMIKDTFPRLEKDVRQIYALRDAEESNDYNPKL